MPARYRQSLIDACGGQLVATAHIERCLLLYPNAAWLEIEQKLLDLPDFDARSGGLKRHMVGHATEIEMDRQGRMLLPPVLREYAHLNHQVMLVGRIKGFELWDEAAWNSQRDDFLGQSRAPGFELPDSCKDLTL
jgi:MraZ protein